MEAPGERNCSILFGLDPEGGCRNDSYDRTQVFNKSSIPLFAKQLNETYNLEVVTNNNFTEETLFIMKVNLVNGLKKI